MEPMGTAEKPRWLGRSGGGAPTCWDRGRQSDL